MDCLSEGQCECVRGTVYVPGQGAVADQCSAAGDTPQNFPGGFSRKRVSGRPELASPPFLASSVRWQDRGVVGSGRKMLTCLHTGRRPQRTESHAAGANDGISGAADSASPHAASFTGRRHCRGAPKASGIRSMVYLRFEMYMIGTPGTFRILRLRSRSQVATI